MDPKMKRINVIVRYKGADRSPPKWLRSGSRIDNGWEKLCIHRWNFDSMQIPLPRSHFRSRNFSSVSRVINFMRLCVRYFRETDEYENFHELTTDRTRYLIQRAGAKRANDPSEFYNCHMRSFIGEYYFLRIYTKSIRAGIKNFTRYLSVRVIVR